MTEIILLSSLVSLLTLGILFLQRINPEKIKIPSYFLGGKSEQRLQQIKTKPPLWWEILAILLFTLGAGLAYFSQSPNTPEGQRQTGGLVWFDPTLSHIKALRGSRSAREHVLEALKELRHSEYIFIELKFVNSDKQIPEPQYQLNKIPLSGLQNYITNTLSNPSSLSQPLDAQRLIQNLGKSFSGGLAETTLTLVTDAQAETIRPLSVLSGAFQSINVVRTPSGTLNTLATGQSTPLVPEELALMWQTDKQEMPLEALPSTPRLIKLEASLGSRIPRQARPTLTLEEYALQEPENSQPQSYALISGQDSDSQETLSTARANPPLFTTCTLSIAGPSELDGLSDLRAYAQYFKVPLRPMACRGTVSATSSKGSDASDPWKFRRSSVWIVPVSDSVAGDLFQQSLFWIPEGFSPENDALVYIADTRLSQTEGLMESVNVQLESNQPSVRLPLLALPPANLTFPWDLGKTGAPPTARPISLNLRNSTSPLLKAADGTPLAFSLSNNPPVVYLRTGGAAPNGELGRWGKWAGLWSQIAAQLKDRSPALTRIQLRTPQDWSKWFEEQSRLRMPKLRYFIDGQNLKAQIINNTEALLPVPALYLRERDDHMILVEPPVLEKLSETLSSAEVEQLFPVRSSATRQEKSDVSHANALQWLGALLALCAILLLWWLQHRKDNAMKTTGALVLLPIILSAALPDVGYAQIMQRLPFDSRTPRTGDARSDSATFPFRIGWCDSTVPEPVKARYRTLQTLLAHRGTINLPRELTPGACRLGASEIWWTSSLEALQAAPVTQHIRSGGFVVAEGISLRQTPEWMLLSSDPSIGLTWEAPKRRGLLYRSFYLLSSFDGCSPERTLILTLRKKVNAQAPMGLVTPVRFLTHTSEGTDCFVGDDDYRTRSFVNLMYGLLTTDYKEDQMQLPEILNRVRNLGLEP